MNIKMLNAFTAEARPRLTSEELVKIFGDAWKADLTYLIKEAGVPVGQFRDPATGGIFFQLKSHEAGAAPASSSPPPESPGDVAGPDEATAEASGPTDAKAPPSSAASPAGPAVATIQTGAREAAGLPPVPFKPATKDEAEIAYRPAKQPPTEIVRVSLRNFRVTSSGGRPKLTATPLTDDDGAKLFRFCSQGSGEGNDVVCIDLFRTAMAYVAEEEERPGLKAAVVKTVQEGIETGEITTGPVPVGDPVGLTGESEELEELPVEEADPLDPGISLPAITEPGADAGAPEKKPEKTKDQLAKEIRDSEIPADLQEASVGMMERGADPTAGMATGDDRAPI
jgi:hypothetical protein